MLFVSSARADGGEEFKHEFLFLQEAAYTQHKGEAHVSAAFDYGEDNDWSLSGELEYGLSERLQVFVEAEGDSVDFRSIEIGLDYALLQESSDTPQLTFGIAAVAPDVSDELEFSLIEPSLRLSKRISESVFVHSSLSGGIDFQDGNSPFPAEWAFGAGLALLASEKTALAFEYVYEAEGEKRAGRTVWDESQLVAGSLSFEIVDHLWVGAAVSKAIQGGNETRFLVQAQLGW